MTQRKRIAICTSQAPFTSGGAEILVEALARELMKRDWPVEVVRIPFQWSPKEEILKGYLGWQLVDLIEAEGKPIDIVIATKFPSFVVHHPHKITWLIQQFRQAYDLFGTEFSPFTTSPADERLRQLIRQIDTRALAESQRLFAISKNVARRLAHYNRLHAEPLYPPPQHEGLYRNEGYGDYVLSVSRLDLLKRVDIIVEAMAHVRTGAGLLIAGDGPEMERLQSMVQERGISNRVEFLGHVEDGRLLDLYANCFALFYGPLDEDYGLVTVEAFKCQKPVLTTSDSGGVLEFVEEGTTGYIVPPDEPKQLADHIDRLHTDHVLCQRLGMAGFDSVRSITWDNTIWKLLEGRV